MKFNMAHFFFMVLFILLGTIGGGMGWLGLENKQVTCFFLFWILGFLLFAFLEWRRQGRPQITLTLTIELLAALFLWGTLGYFFSVQPELSFHFSAKYIGSFSLLLALGFYMRSLVRVRYALWLILVVAVAQTLFCLVAQFFFPEIRILGVSTFNNPNNFANYLLFPVAAGMYLYATETDSKKRWTAFILLTLVLGHLWLTHSRAGIAAGFILTGIMMAWYFRDNSYKTGLGLGGAFAGGFLFHLATSKLLWLLFEKPLSGLSLADKSTGHLSLFMREVFWHGALRIFQDFPITGSGPWTYLAMIPFQGLSFMFSLNPKAGPVYPYHAHNLFLQTASDMGILGLGLLLAVLILFYRNIFRTLRSQDAEHRPLALALGAGMTAYLAHNMFEYCWPAPVYVHTVALWVFMGNVLTNTSPGFSKEISPKVLSLLAATTGALGTAILYFFFSYIQLMDEIRSSDLSPAEKWDIAEQARTYCPLCDQPLVHQAYFTIQQFEFTKNLESSARALSLLQQARQRSPFNQDIVFLKGLLYEVEGRHTEALHQYLRAAYTGRRYEEAIRAITRLGARHNAPVKTQHSP